MKRNITLAQSRFIHATLNEVVDKLTRQARSYTSTDGHDEASFVYDMRDMLICVMEDMASEIRTAHVSGLSHVTLRLVPMPSTPIPRP